MRVLTSDVEVPSVAEGTTQPRGVYVLAAAELWERFSFYGMKALLLLYMVKYLGIEQTLASRWFGYYMAALFLAPAAGGLLADKLLGAERAVIVGIVSMMFGHALMAVGKPWAFYTALTLLVVGTGAFKPNIATLVGRFYSAKDSRRDRGFLLFYLAICVGAALAPLVCGFVSERYGFHKGFSMAAIGMAASALIFQRGWRQVRVHTAPAAPQVTAQTSRNSLLGMLFIAAFAVVYWATSEQIANSLLLFSEKGVDRVVTFADGFVIPPAWFLSLNPIAILILGPPLSLVWSALAAKGREPSTAKKMAWGLGLLGGAFVFLGAVISLSQGPIHAGWYVAFYFLLSLAELCFLPNGLSLVTKLSPAGSQGVLMAVWFLAGFVGNAVAGQVAALSAQMSPASFCTALAALLVVAGVLMALSPIDRYLGEGRQSRSP